MSNLFKRVLRHSWSVYWALEHDGWWRVVSKELHKKNEDNLIGILIKKCHIHEKKPILVKRPPPLLTLPVKLAYRILNQLHDFGLTCAISDVCVRFEYDHRCMPSISGLIDFKVVEGKFRILQKTLPREIWI